MFVNPTLEEVFLVSGKSRIIHAASRISEACGITGEENGNFGIIPAGEGEREPMLSQFESEYSELRLCPHCFERELAAKDKAACTIKPLAFAGKAVADAAPSSATADKESGR